MAHPYLFFDAGGTIVFPHQDFLYTLVKPYLNGAFSPAVLYRTHWELVYEIDENARRKGILENLWQDGYDRALFRRLGLAQEAVETAAAAARVFDRANNLWGFTYPWVAEVLGELRDRGYRMSVISNADGRVEKLLVNVGLRKYFEQVFDSAVVGYEKPHPKIFTTALDALGLSPSEAIYIGDVYSIDMVGANQVGMDCVHLDPAGLYTGWPGIHLPDVRALPGWLDSEAN